MGEVADSRCAVDGGIGRIGAGNVIRLRIASGHPPANTYVNLMQNFFVPEVTKRVAAKTKHKVEFVEGYGGAMVKVADTLEGVQSGIIDIGGYCFCFEPSNLPLHAFQVMLPFGTMDPETSLKVARAVYDKVPYMSKVFEDKFKPEADRADRRQRLQPRHQLRVEHGRRPQGPEDRRRRPQSEVAGVRRRDAGAVVAGRRLHLDADRRLQRLDHVPVGLGQLQALRSRQVLHRDRLRRDHLARPDHQHRALGELPKEVQDIILEVAKEYEAKTGTVNKENYPKQIAELKAHGVNVRTAARQGAAGLGASRSPRGRPQKAKELDAAGLPGTQVLEIALKAAEDNGHKWPVRYSVK